MSTKRVRAELELVFRVRGPFASAAPWSRSAFVDQQVHRVGDRPAVPGTEVLGLLRDGLAALGIADKVNALLGGPSGAGGFDPVRRGLWVSPDFVAAAADTAATLAQTAIDKERGAAREGSLRVVELGARAGETTDLVGRLEWACAEGDAAATAEALVAAAAWIPCLGGHRSVGFGEVERVFYRLTTVALTPAPTPAATPADAESRVLRLRLRDPFCFARPRRSEYMYESEEFVPGAALAGALATSWNELVGRPLGKLIAEDELIAEDADNADLPKLRKYFTYLRFRHAMPAVVDDQGKAVRPTAVPLSRALIKKTEAAGGGRLVDMAAAQTNDGDDAVCYAPDWKGEERDILRAHHGWPRLERRSCVQHGHDRDKRRPADEQLFAYEVIEPDPGVVWIGEVDFRAVPEGDRAQVAAEFDALVAALGERLGHLGKTKARADVEAEPGSIFGDAQINDTGPWYVTLQTPALLGSPTVLQDQNEPDPVKRLQAMYAAAWGAISGGALRLRADNGVFARQSLVGGAYLRGRRGAAKPWLMTEAGSVFVLEAATEKAAEVLGNLLREGLPVDKHAAKFYELENVAEHELWEQFPCGRLVGFGEIQVAAEVGAKIAVPAKPTAPAQDPAAADAPAAPAVTGGEAAVAEIAAAAAPAQPWAKVAVAAAPSGELKAYPDPAPLRVRIEGTLTLRSPLRIGSGEFAAAEGEAGIAMVLRDAEGRPWLPGSSIKGLLRAAFGHDARMQALLGTTAEGGKLRIGPARTTDSPDVCIERRVFAPHDRRRGTVAEHLLANLEVVRAGTVFQVAFEGDHLGKDEVGALLKALAALGDDKHDLALGARSGGGRWGRVKWKHERSLVLTQAGSVRRPTGSWQGLSWRAASLEATTAIGKVRDAAVIEPAAGRRSVFGLELTFAGSLLVAGSGAAAQGEPDKRQETAPGGAACIPESATNVLRAQAERILRTLDIAACSPAAPCSPIHTLADVIKLCLTCRVFGAGGWKGPLQVGEFRAKSDTGAPFVHEMHASDRFTGGVSTNRKFTFAPVRRPVMNGTLSIDWVRLPETDHAKTVVLLALLLRDLAEGDVVFGARSAIGYGQVENLVVTVARRADAAAGGAGLDVATVERALAARWPQAGGPAFADELKKCLAALRPSTDEPKAQSAITIEQKTPANPGAAAQADCFHNPYHFVPSGGANLGSLDAKSALNSQQLSHDRYGADLLSGTLVCEVEAKSPLFVGNQQRKGDGPDDPTTAQFYAPDGTPMLSGSSLRGMVGALIEAAVDGPLRVLADSVLSVRKEMGGGLSALGLVSSKGGIRHIIPLTRATGRGEIGGNLRYRPDGPARYLVAPPPGTNSYHPKNIEYWSLDPAPSAPRYKDDNQRNRRYDIGQENAAELRTPPAAARTKGILRVFGGQGPEDQHRNPKRHWEYFLPFDGNEAGALPAEDACRRFEALMDDVVLTKGTTPCVPVGRERDKVQVGSKMIESVRLRDGDIVFYDTDDTDDTDGADVTEVSVSSIWRRGVGSVHKYFGAIHPELLPMHKGRTTLGLAEQLLGYVSDDGAKEDGGGLPAAWRGRLRFSDAEATEEVKWATEREDALWTLQILGSPKPPSPAMYFRPAKGDGYVAKANMSTDNSRPRGRKAYLHHSGLAAVDPQSKTDKHGNQKLRVRPLAAGSTFRFEIRFDNLTQTELQLLCYALQPHDEFLHKLGLGKPLGMGSVKVAVAEILLCDRSRRYGRDDVNAGRWHASGRRGEQGNWVSASNPAVPSPQDLAAGYRAWAIGQNDRRIRPVLTAIEVVGDPRKLSAPVMYPRQYVKTNGQWILQGEDRLFDWFADNDKKQPQERQHLGTVRDGGVPVLVHTRG